MSIKNKKTRQHQGFTIIETLVAVTILMIAIAGPLTIANKALTASLDAKNVMIASNLAQETMEFVKNSKDNNVVYSSNWTLVSGFDIAACTSAHPCAVSAVPGHTAAQSCSFANNCRLYLSANDGYVYDSSGNSPTPFTSSFYFATAPKTEGSGGYQDALAVVIVSWSTGSVGNQVQLQSLMSSAKR